MLFNSLGFLTFFGILTSIYYTLSHRFRWPLLLAAGLYFYSAFRASYLLLLLGTTLVAYGGGLALGAATGERQRRGILTVSVVAVLGALAVFKYYDFLVGALDASLTLVGLSGEVPVFPRLGLVVAVGLSFYTFSCVSYLADVHARRLPPARHLGHFAVYVTFFPKLLAGPIERAGPFLTQLHLPVTFSGAAVTEGLQLMLWGLFKKVVIADRLAAYVDGAYSLPAFSSPADLVLATYFFAFQLYCDFSGYSDIAIGSAKVLGFDLVQNFRRPYLSTSVSEFWARRWHLSLAAWFRDYMYIPLGGSRVTRLRHHANVMAVFLASGLWHGANWTFVVWGGLNGLYQVVSLMTHPLREHVTPALSVPPAVGTLLRVLLTFHLILVTWVFFRAATLADAATILSRVTWSLPALPGLLQDRLASAEIWGSLTLIAMLLVVEAFDERRSVWERLAVRPAYVRWSVYYALLAGLILLGVWNLERFVYMQF